MVIGNQDGRVEDSSESTDHTPSNREHSPPPVGDAVLEDAVPDGGAGAAAVDPRDDRVSVARAPLVDPRGAQQHITPV